MRTISTERLTAELARRPGLIPISVDRKRQRLIWCDVGKHRFTEPVFSDFLGWLSQHPGQHPMFACELDALETLDLPDNRLEPAGFIFHTGRCGSTLFSRALAQSPAHVVMSEAKPHNDIWWHLTDDWNKPDALNDNHLALFAKLIRLTGRKRDASQQAYFVKFSSWQVLLREPIRKAFPQVPCVFLYRDPAQILVSLQHDHPGWLAQKNTAFGAFCAGRELAEVRGMDTLDYMAHYLANLMQAPLGAGQDEMTYLDYRNLKAAQFGAILARTLNYSPSTEALEQMQAQFGIYSKDVSGVQSFEGDAADKRERLTPSIQALAEGRLGELYAQLGSRAWTA